MAPRGYCILSTPLDLHASCDELIRNYELVRRNIDVIAPFLPQTAEIDVMAGGTSHSNGDIPLLGLFLPSGADTDSRIDDKLQDAIDKWFDTQHPDTLDRRLREIKFPTWEHLVSVRRYPSREET